MNAAYIVNGDTITVVLNGNKYVCQKGQHPNYAHICEEIKNKNWAILPSLFDVKKSIVQFSNGAVSIKDDVLYFNDEELHDTLSQRIMNMFADGFDILPMTKFLINLKENPSATSVKELYLFLETGNMPITDDGHFLAYKRVRNNFTDCHTGKFDNSPGQILEMERNKVDDNREVHCSYGFHFCSFDYLNHFGNCSADKIVLVKINPRDVVSIPSDYNNTKGRCSRYEVLSEVGEAGTVIKGGNIFNSSLYTENGVEVPAFSRVVNTYDNFADTLRQDENHNKTLWDGPQAPNMAKPYSTSQTKRESHYPASLHDLYYWANTNQDFVDELIDGINFLEGGKIYTIDIDELKEIEYTADSYLSNMLSKNEKYNQIFNDVNVSQYIDRALKSSSLYGSKAITVLFKNAINIGIVSSLEDSGYLRDYIPLIRSMPDDAFQEFEEDKWTNVVPFDALHY